MGSFKNRAFSKISSASGHFFRLIAFVFNIAIDALFVLSLIVILHDYVLSRFQLAFLTEIALCARLIVESVGNTVIKILAPLLFNTTFPPFFVGSAGAVGTNLGKFLAIPFVLAFRMEKNRQRLSIFDPSPEEISKAGGDENEARNNKFSDSWERASKRDKHFFERVMLWNAHEENLKLIWRRGLWKFDLVFIAGAILTIVAVTDIYISEHTTSNWTPLVQASFAAFLISLLVALADFLIWLFLSAVIPLLPSNLVRMLFQAGGKLDAESIPQRHLLVSRFTLVPLMAKMFPNTFEHRNSK